MSDREEIVSRVTAALEGAPAPVAIRNARKVDARGEQSGYWVVSNASGAIVASGVGDEAFEQYCGTVGIDPADRNAVVDAEGRILTPGYVDIHSHGAWEKSFDDGPDGIDVARAGHAVHGTTRQVLSLITNPVDAPIFWDAIWRGLSWPWPARVLMTRNASRIRFLKSWMRCWRPQVLSMASWAASGR